MPTAEALLKRVVREPDAEEPRRAYAAAFPPTHPEAERVQAQLALHHGVEHLDERVALEARCDGLQHVGSAWQRAATEACPSLAPGEAVYDRGLLEGVRLDSGQLAEHGEALQGAWPLFRRLHLAIGPTLEPLLQTPVLRGLVELSVYYQGTGSTRLEAAGTIALLDAPQLGGSLRSLSITSLDPQSAGLRALGRSGKLADLTALRVWNTSRPDASALEGLVGDNTQLRALRTLRIARSNVSDEAVSAFEDAATPLEALELDENRLGKAGAKSLAAAPNLAQLRSLELSRNPLGDEGVAALAAGRHWHALRSLRLASCKVGPAGAKALARAPSLDALVHLALSGNKLKKEGARALAGAALLRNVTELDVRGNGLTAEGLLALLRGAPRVATLQVANNPLEKKGFAALAEAELTALRHLVVGYNGAGDDFASLASAPWLSGLRSLSLDGSLCDEATFARFLREAPLGALRRLDAPGFDRAAFDALFERGILQNLTSLNLGGWALTADDLARLANAPESNALVALSAAMPEFEGKHYVEALSSARGLASLRSLNLSNVSFTEAQRSALRVRFPSVHFADCFIADPDA